MTDTQHTPDEAGPRPQLEPEAWKRAGISRSHAYELMAATPPAFPRPVKIGRASRFVSAEVDCWIAGRIVARDSADSARAVRAGADERRYCVIDVPALEGVGT